MDTSFHFGLNLTFTTNCLREAQRENVSMNEMMITIAYGTVERLMSGRLSFSYQGIEVVTCESAMIAYSVMKHSESLTSLLKRRVNEYSNYEFAMMA